MSKWIKWVGVLSFFLCTAELYAQKTDTLRSQIFDYENIKEYAIQEITVSGSKLYDAGQIVHTSGLFVGDTIPIPGEKITEAVKRLWRQGYFGNISINESKIEGDKIWLNISLQERPRIYSWEILGIRKGQVKDLHDNLGLRQGGSYSDYSIKTATDKIKSYFAEKGFLYTEVELSQKSDSSTYNAVKLTFKVDKKEKVKIQEIIFEGNKELSDKKLRRSMKKTKQKGLFSALFKSKKYIDKNYTDDKVNLVSYFNEKGYRDAEILSDSVYKISANRVGIRINLNEGQRYYFRNIEWVGNTKIASSDLSKILKIEKGDVYDQVTFQKMLFTDEQSVDVWYKDQGYLFSQIVPTESAIVGDSIDVQVRISEGDQARFNRINVIGNTKTNEHVARRELLTVPGDLFGITTLRESVRRLANLGYFDAEKLYENFAKVSPNRVDGTVDITYAVEEKPNDRFEISGGWGANMFVGTLGITFSNFSIRRFFDFKAWRPVPSGDGQTLTLRAQTNGRRYQQYSFSFTEPWLGGKKPISFSLSGYYSNQTSAYYSPYSYDYYSNMSSTNEYMKVMGLSAGLGRRLKWPDYHFTLYTELTLQRYMLHNWRGNFIFEDGNSNNFSLKVALGRKSIDQPIFTRTGSDFMLSVQLTPPYSLFNDSEVNYKEMDSKEKYKWIEYHKWSFKGAFYTPIVGDLILYANAQFGYLGYYNKNWGYSPFEGFVVGGDGMSGYVLYGQEIIGLRGYENNSLTPMSTANYAYMGNVYNKFTVEMRFPVMIQPQSTIYLLSFFEAGNCWSNIRDFNPFAVKRSAGVGVRIFLPIVGMLGIDWGYGFDEIPGRPGANGGHPAFVIGQQF